MLIVYGKNGGPSARTIASVLGVQAMNGVWRTMHAFNNNPPIISWGVASSVCYANTKEAVLAASNKPYSRRVMHDAGVSVPEMLDGASTTIPWPCVARPAHHSRGRNLHVVRTLADIARCGVQFDNGYYSQLINKKAEYRVHVASDRALVVQDKRYDPASGVVQANQAVTGQEWRILRWSEITDGSVVHKAMIEAIKACRALGLTFGGVDVMIGMDDKPYIAEVNTAPSVTGGMLLPNKYAAYFRKLAAGEVEALPTTNPLPIKARSLFMKGLVSND